MRAAVIAFVLFIHVAMVYGAEKKFMRLMIQQIPPEFVTPRFKAKKAVKKGKSVAPTTGVFSTADMAYQALEKGKKKRALILFQRALKEEPNNWDLWEDYGYLLLDLERIRKAKEVFERLAKVNPPRESARLQLAYIYLDLEYVDKARKLLKTLVRSRNPKIAKEAKSLLKQVESRFWLSVYSFSYYSSRFGLSTWYTNAILGLKNYKVQPYISFVNSGDTRSRSGDIYNENLVALYFGLQKEILPGMSIYGQCGYFYRFIKTARERKQGGDFQAGVRYYRQWIKGARFGEIYTDLSYYGIYTDLIGSVDLRGGVNLQWDRFVVQPYLGFYGVMDTDRDYWNNLVEGKVGIRVNWKKLPFVWIVGEYVRGYYLGIEGEDHNPYGRWYNEVRIGVLIDFYAEF